MKDIDPSKALGMILLLVIIGAGATAGVTLAGNIVGESVTTVNQAVIVPAGDFSETDVGAADAVVSVNDQGTKFAVGAEAFQGETYDIMMPIENRANGSITVQLILAQVAGPDPINIDVEATGTDELGDGCQVAHVVQVSSNTWRFKLGSSCSDRVQIQVSLNADADPGFYKISGQLKPLEGIE